MSNEQISASEPSVAPDSHRLACMEVWGGSEPRDNFIAVPGMDIAVRSRPFAGDAEGGDVHYISNCMAGFITRVIVADVAGHGVSASEVSGTLRKLMRKHINTPDQSRFARALNEEFTRDTLDARFATALLATYFAPTDHLIICNAGHPPPALYKAGAREWSLLTEKTPGVVARASDAQTVGVAGLPLGVIDSTDYVQFALPLEKGDMVVVYTDGVIESGPSTDRFLGTEGLLTALRESTAGGAAGSNGGGDPMSAISAIESAMRVNAGDGFNDDVTIMAIHHNAADPPRLSIPERAMAMARMVGLVR